MSDKDLNNVMGFAFAYRNNKISEPETVYSDMIDRLDDKYCCKEDGVPLYVKCEACGGYMLFESGKGHNLDGSWKCPSCGSSVKQDTIYKFLDELNKR